jgi:hypothetical protein
MSIKNIVTSQVPNVSTYDAGGNITGVVVETVVAQDITVANSITATTFIGNVQGNITGNLVVPGSNTWVLYNNQGNAGADVGFTYNANTKTANVGNTLLAGNVNVASQISAVGNVHGAYFIGNGSQLIGLPAAYGNANVEAYLPTSNIIIGIDANIANTNSNVSNLTNSLNNTNSNLANVASNVTTLQGQVYTNANVSSYLGSNANVNISTVGNITTTANISGAYILGNGSQLTGLPAGYSNADVATYLASNSNVTITTTGNITTTANISGGNILGNGYALTGVRPQVTATNAGGALNIMLATGTGAANAVVGIGTSGGPATLNPGTGQLVVAGATVGGYGLAVDGGGQPTTGTISATGNIKAGGNILASGYVSVAGNITTNSNSLVSGYISVAGNVTAGNINAPAINLGIGGLVQDGNTTILRNNNVTSNSSVNLYNDGAMIIDANTFTINVAGVDPTLTMDGNGLQLTSSLSATGNITANYFIGNGSQLTGVVTSANAISNGTSNVQIVSANANATVNINGTSNVAVFANTGAYVTGVISASGNINGNYITGNGSTLSAIPGIVNDDNLSYPLAAYRGNIIATSSGFGGYTPAMDMHSGAVTAWKFSAQDSNASNIGISSLNSISAAGNVYSGNVSASGNVTGNYIAGNGTTLTALPVTFANDDDLSYPLTAYRANNIATASGFAGYTPAMNMHSGAVTAWRFSAQDNSATSITSLGSISAVGNITGSYIKGNGSQLTGLPATYSNSNVSSFLANFATNTISTTGNITGGNVNAVYLYGDGSNITGIGAASNTIVNGNSSVSIAANANVTVTSAGNTWTFDDTGVLTVPGAISSLITNQVGSALGIATNDAGGNTGYAADAMSVSYNPTIIPTYVPGSTITFQDNTVATITQVDDYSPIYIDIFWNTPKTGVLFPITLKTSDYVAGSSANATIVVGANGIAGSNTWTFNNVGNFEAPGNISGTYILGNGSQLTGMYGNAEVATYLPTYTGNLTAGNVIFTGNLLVQGTTTTVDSNNVSINDLVFNVANNANAAIYANGAGLGVGTVASEYATFLWNSTSDAWTASNNLSAIGNISGTYISGNGSQLTGMYSNTEVATYLPTYAGLLGGTLTTNAQPNITSLGTLGSLAVTNNINANGLGITGNATIDNLVVTGTTTITGNIQQVSGNSGAFYGDAFGFGALYTGISTGYANLPATVLQVSANYPDYAQVNFQNINSGSGASADYIITADNGTNTTYYVDLGMASSTFDGLSANALGNVVSANDAYLYTFGNGAGQNGGNLIVGAGTDGKVLKLIAGGGTTDNVIATVANTGLTVSGVISASGNINGVNINAGTQISAAGIVYGSNFYTIGQVSAGGNITGANLVATANVIGSNITTAGLVSAAGNVQAGNIRTAGNISATGNVTGTYLVGNVVLNTVNIALGSNSGANSQGASGVAVGNTAGAVNQGTNAIAIGTLSAGNVGTQATSSNAFIDGSTLTILGNITGTFASTMLITGSGVSANTNIIGASTSALANAQISGTNLTLLSAAASTLSVGTSITGVGVTANTYVSARRVSTMTGSSISGTTLTVGTLTGDPIEVGMYLVGAGVTAGVYIVSNISGSGSGSTWQINITQTVAFSTITGGIYTVNQSQTVGPVAMTAGFYTVTPSQTVAGPISITGTMGQGANSVAIGTQAGSNTQSTNAVAIGVRAGTISQGTSAVAIGPNAGSNTQGSSSIAIGSTAGNNTQGTNSVAIGTNAGTGTQGGQSVALGYNAGQTTQGTNAIAIGTNAGQATQSAQAIAIGVNAGISGQGSAGVAIGYQAGSAQGSSGVAVGASAGGTSQGSNSVAVGPNAGATSQGTAATAVGQQAGATSQAANGTTVGAFAGQVSQGGQGVAVGYGSAQNYQSSNGTAIGYRSAQSYQGGSAVAVGVDAGRNWQFNSAVAIGNAAGTNTQRAGAIAIGNAAGSTGLSASAANSTIAGTVFTADGNITGNITVGMALTGTGVSAGTFITALGTGTGGNGTYTITPSQTISSNTTITMYTAQGNSAVAIGNSAGQYGQGANAVAIGTFAGNTSQGINAIAIGKLAGNASQAANSIIINASGNVLNGNAAGLYVNPVRNADGNFATGVFYNTTTKELTYGNATAIGNGASSVAIASSNGSITFTLNGDAAGTITNDFPLKSTVALGVGAGSSGNSGVAIGYSAANLNQGYMVLR